MVDLIPAEEILYGDLSHLRTWPPRLVPPLYEPEPDAWVAGALAVVENEVGRRYNLLIYKRDDGTRELRIFDPSRRPPGIGDLGTMIIEYDVDRVLGRNGYGEFLESGYGLDLGDEEKGLYLDAEAMDAITAWLGQYVR